MSTVVDRPKAEAGPEPPPAEPPTQRRRLLPLAPLVAVYFAAFAVYGFQAWQHEVPWLFQDELFYASQAREFADTGEVTIRGEPSSRDTFNAWVTSIAWHFGDADANYLAAKLLNVALMAAAVFPAYALARLVVRPPWALVAAAGSVAIPAFVYTGMVLTEPLAYLLATTAFWLIVRTLAFPRPTPAALGWGAAALAVIAMGWQARVQLGILFVVFGLATALRLLLSKPVRRRRVVAAAGWVALAAPIYFWYRREATTIGTQLEVVDGFWSEIIQFATWGAGALAIGLLVIPAVLGLASIWPARERRQMPGHVAFAYVAVIGILALLWYTGVKGAFLFFTFGTRVIERNMIYAAPLLFVGVAIFLQYRRVNLLAAAGSLAVVTYAVYEVPYQLAFRIYSDAPGLAILSTANRHLHWTDDSVRKYLAVALAVSVVIVLVPYLLRSRVVVRAGAVVVGVLSVAGALTAEVAADRSSRGAATMLAENLPKPYDWIDEATHGERTVLIGTAIADANGVWLTQFFNPNVFYLASLDASAPDPGPSTTPDIVGANGLLDPQFPDAPFAVVDNKIRIVGDVVRREQYLTLYRIERPLRLTDASWGVTGDGWMSSSARFFQFSAPARGPGVLKIVASRAAWGGPDVPGNVLIKVHPLRWEGPHNITEGEMIEEAPVAVERFTIRTRQVVQYLIPVPAPPFVVHMTVDPTFSPADFGLGDRRRLGIQPQVTYLPGIELAGVVRSELIPPDLSQS